MDTLQVVDGTALRCGEGRERVWFSRLGVYPPTGTPSFKPDNPSHPTPTQTFTRCAPGHLGFLELMSLYQMPPASQDAQNAAYGPRCPEGS